MRILSTSMKYWNEIENLSWPAMRSDLSTGEILPRSLVELELPRTYSSSLSHLVLPPTLKSLRMSIKWNSPVRDWPQLPLGLELLDVGPRFNQSLASFTFPPSLTHLELGSVFHQPLNDCRLPNGLKHLTLSYNWNLSIDQLPTLPESLETLTFGSMFNQPVDRLTLPSSLSSLQFGRCFNQPVDGLVLPKSLLSLKLSTEFDHSIVALNLPSTLTQLKFGFEYRQSLRDWTPPASLKHLILPGQFDLSRSGLSRLPDSLESLQFGLMSDQPLNDFIFPSSLRKLQLGISNHPIAHWKLPSTLTDIEFGREFKDQLIPSLESGYWPSSLTCLQWYHHKIEWVERSSLPDHPYVDRSSPSSFDRACMKSISGTDVNTGVNDGSSLTFLSSGLYYPICVPPQSNPYGRGDSWRLHKGENRLEVVDMIRHRRMAEHNAELKKKLTQSEEPICMKKRRLV